MTAQGLWCSPEHERISEAYKHGLRLQRNFPLLAHALLNLVFQRDDIGSFGAAAVHNGERMLARNAYRTAGVALVKSRVFHQPAGGNLHALRGLEAGQRKAAMMSQLGEPLKSRCADDGILKKRTRAA